MNNPVFVIAGIILFATTAVVGYRIAGRVQDTTVQVPPIASGFVDFCKFELIPQATKRNLHAVSRIPEALGVCECMGAKVVEGLNDNEGELVTTQIVTKWRTERAFEQRLHDFKTRLKNASKNGRRTETRRYQRSEKRIAKKQANAQRQLLSRLSISEQAADALVREAEARGRRCIPS